MDLRSSKYAKWAVIQKLFQLGIDVQNVAQILSKFVLIVFRIPGPLSFSCRDFVWVLHFAA